MGVAAADLVLRLDDVAGATEGGGRWLALPADLPGSQPAGGGGALLPTCLGDRFLEAAVVDSADSGRFVRPEAAMAYSSAVVFDAASAAAAAAEGVAGTDFARCFAAAVGGDLDPASYLGAEVRSVDCGVHGVAAVHRATFVGATTRRAVPVHVDLAVLAGAAVPAVVLVWLADTPDPFPEADRERILGAVAGRLRRE